MFLFHKIVNTLNHSRIMIHPNIKFHCKKGQYVIISIVNYLLIQLLAVLKQITQTDRNCIYFWSFWGVNHIVVSIKSLSTDCNVFCACRLNVFFSSSKHILRIPVFLKLSVIIYYLLQFLIYWFVGKITLLWVRGDINLPKVISLIPKYYIPLICTFKH